MIKWWHNHAPALTFPTKAGLTWILVLGTPAWGLSLGTVMGQAGSIVLIFWSSWNSFLSVNTWYLSPQVCLSLYSNARTCEAFLLSILDDWNKTLVYTDKPKTFKNGIYDPGHKSANVTDPILILYLIHYFRGKMISQSLQAFLVKSNQDFALQTRILWNCYEKYLLVDCYKNVGKIRHQVLLEKLFVRSTVVLANWIYQVHKGKHFITINL